MVSLTLFPEIILLTKVISLLVSNDIYFWIVMLYILVET